ncbi:LysR family transcriptional regulator [Azotobacter beijerinckii]|nr:LysR family transcriptional regulator [Azotobacter beijerinckii]
MSQLEDMRLFVAIVERGSFTAAADLLGLSKQFISRRLMHLEEHLKVRLINRSTRRLDVTPVGQAYYERVVRILQDVEETEQIISSQRATPQGTLRLSAPMSFGTLHLGALMPTFLARYPDVSFELDLSDRRTDLLEEGFDMAIRIGVLQDSTLIARPLGSSEMVTCCSPDYLAKHPVLESPESLSGHECLLYGHGRQTEWVYQRDGKPLRVPVQGRYRVNNGELLAEAAMAGLGITLLPTFIVGPYMSQGRLVEVLQDFRPPALNIHALYPQHRQISLLIRTFSDYLHEVLLLRSFH